MATRKYQPPPPPREPTPTPGLSPEAVAGLSPEALSARIAAREARETSADRHDTARRLAKRVGPALTPPPTIAPERATAMARVAPSPPPPAAFSTVAPNGPQDGDKPWRGAVIRTSRAAPTFDETDAAILLRLLNDPTRRADPDSITSTRKDRPS